MEKQVYNEIKNVKFNAVYPREYAEKLRNMFSNNLSLWYKRVTPESKAEKLYVTTGGDYSEIWTEHCECCFKPINKKTEELCYKSEDDFTWLCEECYNSFFSSDFKLN